MKGEALAFNERGQKEETKSMYLTHNLHNLPKLPNSPKKEEKKRQQRTKDKKETAQKTAPIAKKRT